MTTTPTHRRARHSGSLRHAHLVFVANYRRPVFTDPRPTFSEHTTRIVCADLAVDLTEFSRCTAVDHQAIHRPSEPPPLTRPAAPPAKRDELTPV